MGSLAPPALAPVCGLGWATISLLTGLLLFGTCEKSLWAAEQPERLPGVCQAFDSNPRTA